MEIRIAENRYALGQSAAKHVAQILRETIAEKGKARMVLSTGASQFDTLEALTKEDVQWDKVEMFHLDEYVDLPITHPASFRKYLQERFVDKVHPGKVPQRTLAHAADHAGDPGPFADCRDLDRVVDPSALHQLDIDFISRFLLDNLSHILHVLQTFINH